jgi:hypothetical protein
VHAIATLERFGRPVILSVVEAKYEFLILNS